ncbi:MAG: homocysteine S-methyltransferase family protein [Candidatus Heimdallarchaeota archaeon]|nr:homocysteine S-methyltransferase family protein [Candidatus Heimdallarchaeota archaeon]MCK4289901.1 homocysteine S-methyltransferase family protein [Candidatus Heimdallarchaeota archaeon]
MAFLKWLKDPSKIILGDGSNGTELIKRGFTTGKPPDIQNMESPEIVKEVLNSFYSAGADMVQTITLNATYLNLKRYKLEDKLEDINRQALQNIKDVRPKGKLVVGEIGPSGVFRDPLGSGTFEKWRESTLKQVKILEGGNGGGVDLWHAMGFIDVEEMRAALSAIRKISAKPIIASFIINKGKKGFYTLMGNSLKECIQLLEDENVDVIGANCDPGSTLFIDLVREAKELTDFPLSVKPNAGRPTLENYLTVYKQPVEEFVRDIAVILDLGVKIVGGCCGASPAHIQAVRMWLDSRS